MFRRRFNYSHAQNRRTKFIHPSKYVKSAVTASLNTPLTANITKNFADFPIADVLKINIQNRGYTATTPIQDQTMSHVLSGRDVVGIANTGTGKTAAFLVPIINKILKDQTQKALIMVPTRELAVQIQDELRALTQKINISSVLCIGGFSMQNQLRDLRKNPQIIISTPGRFKDLLNRKVVQIHNFKTVVLDEVDRMVDIGFIHDIRYIISFLPKQRQSLFFSATVSPQINIIIQSFLQNPVTVSVKKTETAQNVEQDIVKVRSGFDKINTLYSLLQKQEFSKVLIFGRTKWGVDRLSKNLQQRGLNADAIHGNKSQNQRLRVLSQFKQNRLKVLIATDVAARGLDIDDISHVINYDEPSTYDDYVHRIGRTGRGSKLGKALTFVEQ